MGRAIKGSLVPCLLALFAAVGADTIQYERDPTASEAPTAAFHIVEDRGTPDPAVVQEARRLLSKTEYAGATVHFMPQKVDNPDCHVVTFEEKRHGGVCSRMAGGMPFCAVKNYVFPNHPDCVHKDPAYAPADSSGSQSMQFVIGLANELPWGAPQWFARIVTPQEGATTQARGEERATTAEAAGITPPPGRDRRPLTFPGEAEGTAATRRRHGRRARRATSSTEQEER